jgi:hypothetical protein
MRGRTGLHARLADALGLAACVAGACDGSSGAAPGTEHGPCRQDRAAGRDHLGEPDVPPLVADRALDALDHARVGADRPQPRRQARDAPGAR